MLKTLIEGVVSLVKLDTVKVVAIISVLLNVWQWKINTEMQSDLNSQIVEEVRRQLPRELQPIKESVDSATFNVNEFVKELKR